jgi:hypothetical protein
MHGDQEIIFSLAGRLHVSLRREINRIIDVEWFCLNAAYAGEVIKLARKTQSAELNKLADRMEEVHPLLRRAEQTTEDTPVATESQYVMTLR